MAPRQQLPACGSHPSQCVPTMSTPDGPSNAERVAGRKLELYRLSPAAEGRGGGGPLTHTGTVQAHWPDPPLVVITTSQSTSMPPEEAACATILRGAGDGAGLAGSSPPPPPPVSAAAGFLWLASTNGEGPYLAAALLRTVMMSLSTASVTR